MQEPALPEPEWIDGRWVIRIEDHVGDGPPEQGWPEPEPWLSAAQASELAGHVAAALGAGLAPWATADVQRSRVTVRWTADLGEEGFTADLAETAVFALLDQLQSDVAETTAEPWPRSSTDRRSLLPAYSEQRGDQLLLGYGTGPEDPGGLHLPTITWTPPPEWG